MSKKSRCWVTKIIPILLAIFLTGLCHLSAFSQTTTGTRQVIYSKTGQPVFGASVRVYRNNKRYLHGSTGCH